MQLGSLHDFVGDDEMEQIATKDRPSSRNVAPLTTDLLNGPFFLGMSLISNGDRGFGISNAKHMKVEIAGLIVEAP